MDKKRYIMPVVAVIEMRGERLMVMGDTSYHSSYGGMPARERIVTTAY